MPVTLCAAKRRTTALKASIIILFLAAIAVIWPAAARADWQPVEKIETYAITGQTGIELYRSIGERGPKVGVGRVIAYTDFKLTWQRNYVPKGGGCTLVSARPKLIITYRLPKAPGKLPGPVRARWDTFAAGIEAHERVHGAMIVDLVKAIEATSVGLSVEGDPNCKKIRTELTGRLAALSQEQRRRSREFDQTEMSDGGNVHRLILGLVND